MTPDEFRDTFNRYYLVHFPDTQAWCRTLSQETKQAWAAMFAKLEVRDLRAAIERVVSGEETIPAYDRERTASILRVLTGRAAYRRQERENSRQLTSQGRRKPARVGSTDAGIEGTLQRIGALQQYRQILAERERRWTEDGISHDDYQNERRSQINREVTNQILYDGQDKPR